MAVATDLPPGMEPHSKDTEPHNKDMVVTGRLRPLHTAVVATADLHLLVHLVAAATADPHLLVLLVAEDMALQQADLSKVAEVVLRLHPAPIHSKDPYI